jgi:glycosyltransferase involved in cell wall biosynthesis
MPRSGKNRPSVTLGIPVYNGERYIGDALDSLSEQTFGDFEVIVSDNASIDATEQICREYESSDNRFRYVRNEKNVGQVNNFNRLFHMARGKYFKWAAHDDLLAPTYLERCVEKLEEHPEAVLATSRVRLVEEDGSPMHFDPVRKIYVARHGEEMRAIDSTRRYDAPFPHVRFNDVVLYLRSSVLTAYVYGLIRSESLARTSLWEPYVGCEKVFLAELSLLGPLLEVPEELFHWRIHPGHTGTKSVRQITQVMDPDWKGRVALFGTRQVIGYLRTIKRAPLPAAQKAQCYVAIPKKVARASRQRAINLVSRSRVRIKQLARNGEGIKDA